jgi:hypothetical protein
MAGLVTNSIRDHAEKELEDLRSERRALLEKAGELGREIAVIEAHRILATEYAAAEGKANGKPAVAQAAPPAPPARGKPAEAKE